MKGSEMATYEEVTMHTYVSPFFSSYGKVKVNQEPVKQLLAHLFIRTQKSLSLTPSPPPPPPHHHHHPTLPSGLELTKFTLLEPCNKKKFR